MREILFKGVPKDKSTFLFFQEVWKDCCDGKFVKGSLIVSKGRYYICVSAMCKINSTINNGITSMIEVIPETVGQYTGKELNGEKLFEGDILEGYEDYDDSFGYPATNFFKAIVCWDEENFCWALNTDGFHQGFNDCSWDYFTKVGNIHDNPELLKGDNTDA